MRTTEGGSFVVPRRTFASPARERDFVEAIHRGRSAAAQSEPARITSYLASRDVACPQCRYNLRGLTEATCPECRLPLDDASLPRSLR